MLQSLDLRKGDEVSGPSQMGYRSDLATILRIASNAARVPLNFPITKRTRTTATPL